ncbi:MAG: glycosyltransferase [Burkholderiaceae bacterium]
MHPRPAHPTVPVQLRAEREPRGGESGMPPLVVFSPLRWNSHYQRPQQLLTRLAKHYRVVYVEEPVTTHEDPWLAISRPAPGVEVLVPHTRVDAPGFHDDQIPALKALLADHADACGIEAPLVWLYTPMAQPLVAGLAPCGVMVDVMRDPASGVAPSEAGQLRDREAALMKIADIVIAGGPSLYQARRGRHPNVHCIPNAVDAEHFAPVAVSGSSIESVSARSLHAALTAGPRLGYFGPIDERVDLELIARVADLRPDWQLVMAGPVVGIAPASLPQRPNVHWIGPQTYAILPHLQAHWDVCLLPLKCAESARHATPIATLEYLAGQKSVVSTPVHDVVALYGHIVRLAADADAFVEACRAALCERGPLRRQRRIDALIAVHSCTWDRAAERVRRLMGELVQTQARERLPAMPAAMAAAMQHAGGMPRYAMN